MKQATRDWADQGEEDWQVAWRESQSPSPGWDAGCFHAQQCAEKYLKGLRQISRKLIQASWFSSRVIMISRYKEIWL
jgi:HEPN domain-containing protein